MRRTILTGIGAALLIASAARRAEACGQGGGAYGNLALALGVGAIVIGGTDVALSLYDLPTVLGAGPRSAGYGVFELVFSLPQLAVGIAGMSSSSNSSGFFTGYTIWMAALAAHGIWTIAAAPRPGPAPALESSGTDPPPAVQETPQLQLSIGPTYAPLGQLAHPGFGLVGRF